MTLPSTNPMPGSTTAQRFTAEVNGDDPRDLRIENKVFVEVTDPPSTPKPW